MRSLVRPASTPRVTPGRTQQTSENNDLLLRNLANNPKRTARFVCVIALAENGAVHADLPRRSGR